jgi:hypothetical protein
MKHVYKSAMVAHLWANKSQDSARTAGRSRLYFMDDTIYSYGSHFPVARHVTRKGNSAVLLTTRSYSATTASHKSMVASACRHLTVFHVADVTSSHPQFTEYSARYKALVGKYAKARQRKPEHLDALRHLVEEANQFAKFFGLRSRLTLPDDLTAMVAQCKAMEKRDLERKHREQQKHERKQRELIERWMNGEPINLGWTYIGPVRLRINGETLETSKGAEIPVSHAIKAYRIIKQLRRRGETYERNGHTIHLGQFTLDRVDETGVTAGCHHIEWSEVERIATLLGV